MPSLMLREHRPPRVSSVPPRQEPLAESALKVKQILEEGVRKHPQVDALSHALRVLDCKDTYSYSGASSHSRAFATCSYFSLSKHPSAHKRKIRLAQGDFT